MIKKLIIVQLKNLLKNKKITLFDNNRKKYFQPNYQYDGNGKLEKKNYDKKRRGTKYKN